MASSVINIQDRPVYGFAQVDRILGLKPTTASRWIDGYTRNGTFYPPVVRPEKTGSEVVTWGEFIEARLLAQYRTEGARVQRMRPAVVRLREELGTIYPLASAQTWLAVEGRELVRRIQDEVGLDRRLLLVVTNDQQMIDWSDRAQQFADSLQWNPEKPRSKTKVVTSLRPDPEVKEVEVNPLLRFGEPSTRGVPTEVIRELYTAGDPIEMIAELYELSQAQVEAALRYELRADSARAS
ncbi:DUF433 domain-containing protein [Mycobacteroides chelonae]|uniref:DUF433 domain-containing protein n=1 Tax=Mycobacteroides chelonae TaxID=1774 RepID=UPI001A95C8AA|nr:DUF433 domain-containing protein [Mycobacteroides chelonae]